MIRLPTLAAALIPIICSGQTTLKQAEAEALRLYPELGKKDSPLNQRFISIYERERASNPKQFKDPQWPLKIARRAAAEINKENGQVVAAPFVLAGCMNVEWGMSIQQARAIITMREGTAINEKESTPTSIRFGGGTFADQSVDEAEMEFFEDKFCSCTIVITPKNTLDDSWRQLAQGFLNKYGRPVTFKRDSLSAVWLFETVGRTKSEALYCLANRSKNHAVLIYQDSLLFEKSEADRKKNAPPKDL